MSQFSYLDRNFCRFDPGFAEKWHICHLAKQNARPDIDEQLFGIFKTILLNFYFGYYYQGCDSIILFVFYPTEKRREFFIKSEV